MEYLTEEDIHTIHERVVDSDADTEAGIRTPTAIESALLYISEGYFGQVPETIHEKAAHLLRLIAAEHAYVDGNKRTALAATAAFYDLNGYDFAPDDEVRAILREFATDSEGVDISQVVSYLEAHTAKQ